MTHIPPVPSGIYAIRNAISGRIYVGSAVKIASRWSGHRSQLRKGTHHSKTLQRSWAKHGSDAFIWEVLERVPDLNDLTSREQHWMDLLHAACPKRGFNSRPKAESPLGWKRSAEDCAKQSARQKGKKLPPMSAETKALLRAQRLGKKHTAEHRAAIGAAQMGRKMPPMSAKQKAQLAEARRGKPLSIETRAKLSAAFRGKKLSPQAAEKVRANLKLRVAQSIETLRLHRPDLRGRKQTAEHRAKNRDAQIGKKHTPEAKERMRAAALVREARHRMDGTGTKGKKRAPFTAEHRASMSRCKAGKPLGAEHRAKVVAALKNVKRVSKHSDATKALLSEKAKIRQARIREERRASAEQGSLPL